VRSRLATLILAMAWLLPHGARADDAEATVTVKGTSSPLRRGAFDMRIERELLQASPRQQTSEMLSAAPGFFVDHEDGEGLGNDIYLRGFDLSHGSGIEMRLGSIPLNIPHHVQGQGYADTNFIIPEVVRSIRVLQGPYDPRQGDAAIVGSAYFDLGVIERGYQLKSTYGSFDQARVLAVVAPREMNDETFAAFSVRGSGGFGQSRASKSGSAVAEYAIDLGPRDSLKLVATAYGTASRIAGVVRRDDVDAGRIGFYDAYPTLSNGQGVDSTRVILGADFQHVTSTGALFAVSPWAMWTNFRARQNFTGNLETGIADPTLFGLGDLYETRNREIAAGFTAKTRAEHPYRLGSVGSLSVEPGLMTRAGQTSQGKSLLETEQLLPWDRRLDLDLETLDVGAWVDLDLRLGKHLRLSGGPRADLLAVSVDDRIASASRSTTDVAAGPRATLTYDAWKALVPMVSYGEGFRSLDADRLGASAQPYSKVRSGEIGVRSSALGNRFVTTVAAFETYVGNELVFEAEAGGLETQKASIRRGVVTSLLVKPVSWLLVSSALSITRAEFTTLVPGISHFVPSVPSVLFRTDATVRGTLTRTAGHAVEGRAGLGYTLLAGRHLTDAIMGAPQNILNANVAMRWGMLELGVDCYNLLGLRYPDDEQVYASNWTTAPRSGTTQAPASIARHITASPPRTVLGSLSVYF